VHEAGHQERRQDAGRGAEARADGAKHRRPEDGGHHEVPPPAPEVTQRRRQVRVVHLWLHLHPEQVVDHGVDGGEQQIQREVDVQGVEGEELVPAHRALELVRVDDARDDGAGEEYPRRPTDGSLALLFGLLPELDGEGGRAYEVEEAEGRVEGPDAGGEEEHLKRAEPGKEEARGTPERGRREGEGNRAEERDDGQERQEARRAWPETRRGEAGVGHRRPHRRGDLDESADLAVH